MTRPLCPQATPTSAWPVSTMIPEVNLQNPFDAPIHKGPCCVCHPLEPGRFLRRCGSVRTIIWSAHTHAFQVLVGWGSCEQLGCTILLIFSLSFQTWRSAFDIYNGSWKPCFPSISSRGETVLMDGDVMVQRKHRAPCVAAPFQTLCGVGLPCM